MRERERGRVRERERERGGGRVRERDREGERENTRLYACGRGFVFTTSSETDRIVHCIVAVQKRTERWDRQHGV